MSQLCQNGCKISIAIGHSPEMINSCFNILVHADCFVNWNTSLHTEEQPPPPTMFSFEQCDNWNAPDAEIVLEPCIPCDPTTPPNIFVQCSNFPPLTDTSTTIVVDCHLIRVLRKQQWEQKQQWEHITEEVYPGKISTTTNATILGMKTDGGVAAWKIIVIALGLPLMFIGCIGCVVVPLSVKRPTSTSTRTLNENIDVSTDANL